MRVWVVWVDAVRVRVRSSAGGELVVLSGEMVI